MRDQCSALPADQLLANLPPVPDLRAVDVREAVLRSGRTLVVLDDDPTGTQTVADLPVLTSWTAEDLRWAFRQERTAFYVLLNTRSLTAERARMRNQEVVAAVAAVAASEGREFVVASRSDSTLRGHYPLETEVLAAELLARTGRAVDGVVVVPAYLDAGRVTVDSVHWSRTDQGFLPVGQTEFARDPAFGYRASDLREWVVEKGGWPDVEGVGRITLDHLRTGGPDAVARILADLSDGRPVVVDAVDDADLLVLTLGILRAEEAGAHLLYRVGPSFVRARAGLEAREPLDRTALAALRTGARRDPVHGLIVVGSHVPRTSRQLRTLSDRGDVHQIVLDVPQVLAGDAARRAAVERAASTVVQALNRSDVALVTSRELVTDEVAEASLQIAASVSAALVDVVRRVIAEVTPGWVVGKGGITSNDIATEALGITRAWIAGTLLPGIVSVWDPVTGPTTGTPYVVFAGNVGDDDALSQVVATLRAGSAGTPEGTDR